MEYSLETTCIRTVAWITDNDITENAARGQSRCKKNNIV